MFSANECRYGPIFGAGADIFIHDQWDIDGKVNGCINSRISSFEFDAVEMSGAIMIASSKYLIMRSLLLLFHDFCKI